MTLGNSETSAANRVLSVTEWQNLLAALKTVIERYELGNVAEAIKYLEKTR